MLMKVGLPVDRLTQSAAPRPGVGIVHLGLGAFYRAFGAVYVAEAMAASGAIGALSVSRSKTPHPAMRSRLRPGPLHR